MPRADIIIERMPQISKHNDDDDDAGAALVESRFISAANGALPMLMTTSIIRACGNMEPTDRPTDASSEITVLDNDGHAAVQ